jgi:hypothetical protein
VCQKGLDSGETVISEKDLLAFEKLPDPPNCHVPDNGIQTWNLRCKWDSNLEFSNLWMKLLFNKFTHLNTLVQGLAENDIFLWK